MIKERLFWTWDHSTNRCVNTPGAQWWGGRHALGNFLNSYLYEIEAGGKLENMCPHDADRPDLF